MEEMMAKKSGFLDDMDEMEMPPEGGATPSMDDVEEMSETDSAGPDLSSIPDDVLQAELDKRKGGNPMQPRGGNPMMPSGSPGVLPPQEGPGNY